jgi:hypothetical protein
MSRLVARERRRSRDGKRERALLARDLLLLSGVAEGDVDDLVAEHAGELVFVVDEREQPARDVDEAPGQGEGVGLHVVDDREVVGEVPTRESAEELPADARHVGASSGSSSSPTSTATCFAASAPTRTSSVEVSRTVRFGVVPACFRDPELAQPTVQARATTTATTQYPKPTERTRALRKPRPPS